MDLATRFEWQQLHTRHRFHHVGGANYLALDINTALPDYHGFVNRSLWDVTSRLEVNGPLNPKEWTTLTTMLISQARYSYRMQGGALYIFGVPSPLSAIDFQFEYISHYGVYNPVTLQNTETYTDDTSYPRLPARLILADIKWRWKANKGLPYAEDQRAFELMITDTIGREPQSDLVLDQQDQRLLSAGPNLLVAAGSWPL